VTQADTPYRVTARPGTVARRAALLRLTALAELRPVGLTGEGRERREWYGGVGVTPIVSVANDRDAIQPNGLLQLQAFQLASQNTGNGGQDDGSSLPAVGHAIGSARS
jgi:hypothetical protein